MAVARSKPTQYVRYGLIYGVLSLFAFFMLFPFLFMFFTSFKEKDDVFNYPPRLLPYAPVNIMHEGEERPLYYVTYEGAEEQFVLIERSVRVGTFVDPINPSVSVVRELSEVTPVGGTENPQMVTLNGEDLELFNVPMNGQTVEMAKTGQTAYGRFADPANPERQTLQNVRLSRPVEQLTAHPENYSEVLELQNLDRSLSNTTLVTVLVVLGTVVTSVLGGYAFARLDFPGRNQLFTLYLGTIMIPFVVLITPMYQLMVLIGWQDRMVALIVPWIFSAYGTFLMRQFFITIPKELEEAALLDGASRLTILWRIIVPISMPAIATLVTFTFLYAWNSFFWPLIIINTGNYDNHVLTLALSVLRGRAADSPNLVMAGAAIAVLPPMIIFIFAQRYFVEGVANTGLKG